MRELHFMPKAWQDLGWWMKNDIKNVKKTTCSWRIPAKPLLMDLGSLNRSKPIIQVTGLAELILSTESCTK